MLSLCEEKQSCSRTLFLYWVWDVLPLQRIMIMERFPSPCDLPSRAIELLTSGSLVYHRLLAPADGTLISVCAFSLYPQLSTFSVHIVLLLFLLQFSILADLISSCSPITLLQAHFAQKQIYRSMCA